MAHRRILGSAWSLSKPPIYGIISFSTLAGFLKLEKSKGFQYFPIK